MAEPVELTATGVPINSPLADYVPDPAPVEQEDYSQEPEEIIPEGQPEGAHAPKSEVKPDGEGKPYAFALDPAWKQLEKDGIVIPEDFKKGKFGEGVTEWDAFRNLVIENTEVEGGEPDEDTFIQNYKKLPADQRGAYLKTYNDAQEFFTLPAKDGLKSWYQSMIKKDAEGKDVRQYEDKAIDDYLEKMSPIELDREWNQAKGNAKQRFDEYYNQGSEQHTQKESERIAGLNKKQLESARTVAAEIDTMPDFNGVPITPEQKAQAKRNFIALTQINPETGKPHLLSLLNDNKKLMRFVLADTLFDGDYVNDYIATRNENFKDVLLNEKLDIAPKPKRGIVGKPSGGNKPVP